MNILHLAIIQIFSNQSLPVVQWQSIWLEHWQGLFCAGISSHAGDSQDEKKIVWNWHDFFVYMMLANWNMLPRRHLAIMTRHDAVRQI